MANEKASADLGWIVAPEGLGPVLAERLEREVSERRKSGSISESEERQIQELSVFFSPKNFSTSPARLELLRSLCRTFSVEFKPEIAPSHRRVVGPVIAAVKRAMVPFFRALLGPIFLKQSEFNASVVKLLGELSNEQRR